LERLVLAILVGLAVLSLAATLFLGPGLLAVVFLIALAAFGMEQLVQRDEARAMIHDASAMGISDPVFAWGKVAHVYGDCPDGQNPPRGTKFVVAGGKVEPAMCQHVRRAILTVVGRMEEDEELLEAPVRHNDAVHQVDIELYRAPAQLRAEMRSPAPPIPGPRLVYRAEDESDNAFGRSSESWLPRAIVSSFMATILMSVGFFAAFAFSRLVGTLLPSIGVLGVLREWLMALTANRVLDVASNALYVAGTLHLVVGVVWGLAYAYVFEPRLSGPAWLKGMKFALLPWILSVAVFLPLAGGGPLGLALGAGPLPIIGNFLLHLVYGLTLGAVYGPLGDIPADQFPRTQILDHTSTIVHEERAMANGIVVGAFVGGLLGVLGAVMAATSPTSVFLGAPPLAFFAMSLVLGATFGCFVGSMAGLAPETSRS